MIKSQVYSFFDSQCTFTHGMICWSMWSPFDKNA